MFKTFVGATGGEDNVFPHHECEIAQSEAANEQTFVNLWMHTRFLQVDGGKIKREPHCSVPAKLWLSEGRHQRASNRRVR